jgi:hypothetical protein
MDFVQTTAVRMSQKEKVPTKSTKKGLLLTNTNTNTNTNTYIQLYCINANIPLILAYAY